MEEKYKNEVIGRLRDTVDMLCDIYMEAEEFANKSDDVNFVKIVNKLEVIKDRLQKSELSGRSAGQHSEG